MLKAPDFPTTSLPNPGVIEIKQLLPTRLLDDPTFHAKEFLKNRMRHAVAKAIADNWLDDSRTYVVESRWSIEKDEMPWHFFDEITLSVRRFLMDFQDAEVGEIVYGSGLKLHFKETALLPDRFDEISEMNKTGFFVERVRFRNGQIERMVFELLGAFWKRVS